MLEAARTFVGLRLAAALQDGADAEEAVEAVRRLLVELGIPLTREGVM